MDTFVIIDYDKIIHKNNYKFLYKKFAPVPKTRFHLVLIIIIPPSEYNKLSIQTDLFNYMNTKKFLNVVKDYAYIEFNQQNVEILKVSNYTIVPSVVKIIHKNISAKASITACISLNNTQLYDIINIYENQGFMNPYITKTSPLNNLLPNYHLCMSNKTTNNLQKSSQIITEFLQNRKQSFFSKTSENGCEFNVKLPETTVTYLKNKCYEGYTLNSNGTTTQKEIAGNLSDTKNENIYVLTPNTFSLIKGDEEGVDIVPGIYNFHSHPKDAYITNNVELAWPSAQDYIGFILSVLEDNARLHIVSSLEGLYIISVTKYWLDNKCNIDKQMGNFILDKYGLCHTKSKSPHTSEQYIEKVNSIKYNKNSPIFYVQFFKWPEAPNQDIDFSIIYCDNHNNSCPTKPSILSN